ncbi:aspartic-type endopeptidase [Diplodia corticola]|uniref:Aspartic-type endopeptidase n=1 Tax=Diplodia corticola TaxID=236234 RepID=A0A1J9QNK4_9PEZI|nr:aspartic-type endopeptidase [Diplodia corticola]OJD29642.1 aspartic-type endopeptidase [Diplodia corticola]
MRRLARCSALLLGLAAAAGASGPWGLEFDNEGTGPDGPWTYLLAPVDSPGQVLGFYPSLLETTMMVNASVCQYQTARCVIPNIAAWSGSSSHDIFSNATSDDFAPSKLADVNGGYAADLMSLQGSMRYTTQRLTLGTTDLDGLAMAIADNVTAGFPNGDWYTVGIGYYSLYGGDTFTYDAPAGTQTLPLTLSLGYERGVYASMSYGLHIGSVMHNITGKLYLGGYDRARCISDPITVSANATFSLADVSLGVAAGGSAFLNNTSSASSISGLLQTNTSSSSSSLPLSAQPDPGLPYLYLPAATCAAIASYLPVTYDAGLNLYLWNTSAPSYLRIVSSPHHLTLHFHQSGTSGPTTPIAIPFALLNLTLSYPLLSDPTPYFPCRPHDSDSSSSTSGPDVVLGRAFLQAAHLAQNWHTASVWLAQAPGPAFAAEDLKTIATGDDELTEHPTAGRWNDTWSGVLEPLEGEANGGSTTDSGSGSGSASGSASEGGEDGGGGGLSAGAKAGVGVGVAVGAAALIGLVAGVVWRRKRRGGAGGGFGGGGGGGGGGRRPNMKGERVASVAELPSGGGHVRYAPVELEGGEVQEMPADGRYGGGVKEMPGR